MGCWNDYPNPTSGCIVSLEHYLMRLNHRKSLRRKYMTIQRDLRATGEWLKTLVLWV